jgi:serine O-acetyltransferase
MVEQIEQYGNPEHLSLLALVREDYATNGRDWTAPGFRALAVHRFGNWRMGIDNKLVRAPLSVLYRSMARFVRNHYGIELPFAVRVGRRVAIDHQSGIVIHGYTVIGDDCRIRQNTTMGVRNLQDPNAAPILERGVDVGAGAVIVGRITIGEGASIGANAVVLQDVPPGALAIGVPAKIVERAPRASA